MEEDETRLEMLRESIGLTNEILANIRDGSGHSPNANIEARLMHARDWRMRYLSHLEQGGQPLNVGDEWSMHHGHDLAIEWGYESWDENRIGLRCRSCDDWIQLYDVEQSGSPQPAIVDLYLEHETHTVISWRRGTNAGLECVTCGAASEDGFSLLDAPVSAWFDDVWNG